MKLTNTTPYPAIAFEGIDQLGQAFHVVVMRQTYTWNELGLLVVTEDQDPLRFEDQLADPNDLMSGILEESDLAHYKPKCDVIIKGHAYTPPNKSGQDRIQASIQLQSPDSIALAEPVAPSKYAISESTKPASASNQYTRGQVLIDKTLTVLSPRHATIGLEGIAGNVRYSVKSAPMPDKVSLNPSSSFGGYCLMEENHPAIRTMDINELIPKEDRSSIKLNPHHGTIAYLAEDNFNPAGKGFITPPYFNAIKPKRIEMSQIHHPDFLINGDIVNQVVKGKLDDKAHHNLVAGFGIRAKSHPERSKLIGTINQAFITSDAALPQGFDFAMWNGAYPDLQTEYLTGNEWITLTNLCSPATKAARLNKQGDIELKLYLPEVLPYLALESSQPAVTATELPMKLDTVIVSPDSQTVNLVWRSMVISDYQPKVATLAVIDRQMQADLIKEDFVQTSDIVRPYNSAP